MKRICITYHLRTDHSKPSDNYPHNIETAENCITTSFTDEIANEILENQRESKYTRSMGALAIWLNLLAEMQGYTEGAFLMAEEDELV